MPVMNPKPETNNTTVAGSGTSFIASAFGLEMDTDRVNGTVLKRNHSVTIAVKIAFRQVG